MLDLGQPGTVADLGFSIPALQKYIDLHIDGTLDENNVLVTPATIFNSDLLKTVYTK